MKWRNDFAKAVWGFMEVEATSKEDAEKRYENGDYDEFDSKSEYELGEWEAEE